LVIDCFKICRRAEGAGVDPKDLDFNNVYMRTHRRSGLLISKIALEKLFRYLINRAGATRQNLVSRNHDF